MDHLTGTVERITFHNEENGYTVAQLTPEGKSYTVTLIGNMLGINVGEHIEVTGQWASHPQYGRQFRVDAFHLKLPATAVGIEKYLGSGLVKGVGPVTARRIVRQFGADALRVIDETPARLVEVPGVGPKRVEMIEAAWREQRAIREVMLFLQDHEISTGLAVKIYRQYGDESVGIVRQDPYRLARDISGIGFITADRIAHNLGLPLDSPARAAAGVTYVLHQHADDGHVYVPQSALIDAAASLLEVPATLPANALAELQQQEDIRVEELARRTHGTDQDTSTYQVATPQPLFVEEERAVYLMPFYYGEIGVASRLRRLQEAPSDRLWQFQRFDWTHAFGAAQHQTGIVLAPPQRTAVEAALTGRLTVLTGGPGTGKTSTVQTIIRILEATGRSYLLAAPTGRAAKRLSEATGRAAKTIHRLLEFKPGGGLLFQRHEQNPLDADMIIVDEASMLDLLLANHLLRAIPNGAHLLLVGDVDQLPSVGAGDVLRDIIDSGIATVVRLETIFRQASGSYIIENAHRINRGEMPEWHPARTRDFFLFKAEDAERAAGLVVEVVTQRIPGRFGLAPAAIQVLSPMHRGPAGVGNLNTLLQAALNPPDPHKPEKRIGGHVLRLGDRVMQTTNNYQKDVFNGDVGDIVHLKPVEQVLTVDIDGRAVDYSFLELDELVLAYAISVHKAQGSEYPAVVIPLLTQHYMMLQRNLLYTAVTRARQLVVIVGSPRAIAIAVRNNRVAARYTGLAERLRGG